MTAFPIPDFAPAIPEIWLASAACLVLVVGLFTDAKNRAITLWLALATLVVTGALVLWGWPDAREATFSGAFVHDEMGAVLKLGALVIGAFVLLCSRQYLALRGLLSGEYTSLALFSVLGMLVMISAGNFITVYLGLELLSLALYAMVALDRDSAIASESAMKYFVLGAIASGLLLYGMSLLYGLTGSLDLATVSTALAGDAVPRAPALLALVFVVVGLTFKLGAVPFHMWVPDVYHGAPTAVTLWVGTAPKIAAFALLMRMLVDGLAPLHPDWQSLLTILAVLSLAIGNVVAIAQTNLKRMLAYSTISHIGFLLLGVLAGTAQGYASAMFYALVYALMAAGGFAMILVLSRSGFEADRLDDFRGLNHRSPWFAFVMLILMASMAGLPPMVGFWAKLWVLAAVIDVEMVWLAAVAVGFSIIGAYYYLRVIKLMYFDDAEDEAPLAAGLDLQWAMSANGLAVIGLGLFPGSLLAVCTAVFLP